METSPIGMNEWMEKKDAKESPKICFVLSPILLSVFDSDTR